MSFVNRPDELASLRAWWGRLIRKAASLTPDANDLRYAVCARRRDEVEHADQDTLTVTAKDIFGT